MKCVECVDYAECSKKYNLTIKRKHCPVAKVEYVQTNADRIRAMSDEELAGFLECEDWLCDTYNRCSECPMKGEGGKCLSVLEWLKHPDGLTDPKPDDFCSYGERKDNE